MSSNVTRQELRDRIRFEADMVNSKRATDAQINTLINTHLAEFYGRLVEAGPPDYFSTDYTFSSVPGTESYAVPSDFKTMIALYALDGTRKREISPLPSGRIAEYDVPDAAVSLMLRYVPAAPKLTTDTDAITGTIDGVSGWEELVVQLVARALRKRDNRDVSSFDVAIAEKRAEMIGQARHRVFGAPRYITDVEPSDCALWWATDTIDAYVLRAGFLDLYTGALLPY